MLTRTPLSLITAAIGGVVTTGCLLLTGPLSIPTYVVSKRDYGAGRSIDPAGRRLRIDHPQLLELAVVALPSSDGKTDLEVRITPREGVRVSLSTAQVIGGPCGMKPGELSQFTELLGAGSSHNRGVSSTIVGGTMLSQAENRIPAPYVFIAPLPIAPRCLAVELPDLIVDGASVRLGNIEFNYEVIRSWAYGT